MDKGTKILITINVILVISLAALYFVLFSDSKTNNKHEHRRRPTVSNQLKEMPEIAEDRDELESMIKFALGKEVDKFAIYVFRPNVEKQPLIFQSRPMRPASMIKVFVLAKVMQDAKDGKLALDELIPITANNIVGGAGSIAGEGVGARVPIRQAAELMITESDNTATNILIDRVGLDNLNQYLRDKGYNDTFFHHKMMLQTTQTNLSSVADLGLLFTRIYEHNCVDDYYDHIMIDYLLKQDDTDCFPMALPYWNIAHKTGEVENLYDDGGIFYGSAGDFILVIMDDNFNSRGETIERMRSIAMQIARDFMVNKYAK